MSDFKAKMHQIRFRLGLRPRPRWGSLHAPQTPYLDFGPTSKGGRERGGEGKRGEGRYKGSLLLREGGGGEREGKGRGRGGKGKGWKGRWKDPLVFADMKS